MVFVKGDKIKNICVFCGGDIRKKIVRVLKEYEGEAFIIENVPAGVCTQCGEREYAADIALKIRKHFER